MSDTKPDSEQTSLTNRPIVAGTTVSSTDHESWRNDVEGTVDDLIAGLKDNSNHRAGTSAPTDNSVEGQIYCDTTNDPAVLKADLDGAGADTQLISVNDLASIAEVDAGTSTTKAITPDALEGSALQTKVDGIETGATADQTGAEIKTAYEAEANAYTDTKNTKLAGIETGALATRILNANTTQVGNVGSGEDDLMSYTLPGGTLGSNGEALRITAWGTTVTSGKAVSLTFYFGSTSIALATAGSDGDWFAECIVSRVSATTQTIAGLATLSGNSVARHADGSETLSGAVILKMTGQNNTDGLDNAIQQTGMIVELLA